MPKITQRIAVEPGAMVSSLDFVVADVAPEPLLMLRPDGIFTVHCIAEGLGEGAVKLSKPSVTSDAVTIELEVEDVADVAVELLSETLASPELVDDVI